MISSDNLHATLVLIVTDESVSTIRWINEWTGWLTDRKFNYPYIAADIKPDHATKI